jgi:TRAP transporter TAXI family solute receptor
MGDKVKFVEITTLLPKLQETNQAYQAGSIPAATYRTAADVPTIVVPNVLLVKEDLDANAACVLTKTLFDKRDELVKANAAAKGIGLETARKTNPVPLHRGAKEALDKLGAK